MARRVQVPEMVDQLAFLRALKRSGDWASVKAWMEANDLMDEWIAAQRIARNDPLVGAFQAHLQVSDAYVDAVFRDAKE